MARRDPGIVLVRVAVAGLLAIHGLARILAGAVEPFGEFLTARGLPFGGVLAWSLSIFEVGGGALLALGRWPVPIAALLALELVAGIALVHAAEGWFVVGLGRNGVEYSVCLIAALTGVILSERGRTPGAQTPK
jgi:putative oxidoreductase